MLVCGDQVRLTKKEADFVKYLTGRTELPKTVSDFDTALETSAQAIEDGSAEGRLLAGLIRLSKTTPDVLAEVPEPDTLDLPFHPSVLEMNNASL